MTETVKYRYRVTILRASGSVWVQDYNSAEDISDNLVELITEYPHLVVSKQRIITSDDDENE